MKYKSPVLLVAFDPGASSNSSDLNAVLCNLIKNLSVLEKYQTKWLEEEEIRIARLPLLDLALILGETVDKFISNDSPYLGFVLVKRDKSYRIVEGMLCGE